MRRYCGESMHRAIMGAKEGRKAVGELWRDVFCRMVCPPSPRNAPRTLILVKQSVSSIQISVVIFLTEEPARDKSPRTDKCEDSIISCCTDRNAVIVSSADRLWWKSRLYTVIWTHICGVPLRLWHGAHRGVRIKSKRSSGMNWGENIFVFSCESSEK